MDNAQFSIKKAPSIFVTFWSTVRPLWMTTHGKQILPRWLSYCGARLDSLSAQLDRRRRLVVCPRWQCWTLRSSWDESLLAAGRSSTPDPPEPGRRRSDCLWSTDPKLSEITTDTGLSSTDSKDSNCPPPLNFSLSKNYPIAWKIFFQKCKIWGWKSPIWTEFGGKIEIPSTHDVICQKLQLHPSQLFLTHSAAADDTRHAINAAEFFFVFLGVFDKLVSRVPKLGHCSNELR